MSMLLFVQSQNMLESALVGTLVKIVALHGFLLELFAMLSCPAAGRLQVSHKVHGGTSSYMLTATRMVGRPERDVL